jgi:subtilisin family serine protease
MHVLLVCFIVFQCIPSEALISMAGTSMATPLTAGSVALVRQYFMQGYSPAGVRNPSYGFTPSAALVKSILINSAQPMQYLSSALNMDEPAGRTKNIHSFDSKSTLY